MSRTSGASRRRLARPPKRNGGNSRCCSAIWSAPRSSLASSTPEDLRAVVRAYQETAAEVIQRYEGHIAQYLGDGLLVYFGYPIAHEDDARREIGRAHV